MPLLCRDKFYGDKFINNNSNVYWSKHSWNFPLDKRRGSNFRNFRKKGGSESSHKKGGVGKIGGDCFKKRGYHLFSY